MRRWLMAGAVALLATGVQADETVTQPWAKSSLADSRSTGVFMEILSTEGGVIIGARSPLARAVELRDMSLELDGGPLRPVKLEQIVLPARKKLYLTPVSEHFMLIGLSQPVKAGDRIPLIIKLRLRSGEERELQVEAIARGMPLPAAAR